MPSLVTGQRDTLNIETGRIKKDVEAKIALLDPQVSPLMTAISTIGRQYVRDGNGSVKVNGVPVLKKATTSSRFEWWEDQLLGTKSNVNLTAGYSSSDTSIVVDDGTIFFAGAVIWNPRTSEILECSAVSTNTLTVRRGVGNGGTGVAILNRDEFIVIGNVYPEGAVSRTSKSTLETNVYNYTQIIRTPVEITETMKNTDTFTEDEWKYQVAKAGVEHLKSMERTLWFGKREQSTNSANNADGKPKRFTGGILSHFLQTNVMTAPATLTEAEWDSFLEVALRKGSTMKYVFCSSRVLTVVSNFAKNKLQTKIDDKTYGVSIHEYQSPHGTVKLVKNPIFDETEYTSGHAVALDMNNIKYRYLQNRDTKFLDNRQENDRDGQKGEYLTEMGLQLQLESEMAVLKGVRG